ncbi:hypothetical protein [Spirillospora albida]|uniref:hypothetical protein n=1 Tax=Spirillospora albida TaxID=58123 RepID=UPI0004C119BE|nr:hypothetical protein [Spirillospora albida]
MSAVTRYLTGHLDEIAAEVAGEITARGAACGFLRDLDLRTPVLDALAVCTNTDGKAAALAAFRDLGAQAARAGQDAHVVEAALRAGGRVLVRRLANAAATLYPPTGEFITVMEDAFTGESEFVRAAIDAHRLAAAQRLFTYLHGTGS